VTTLIYIDYIFLYVSGLNRKVCGSKAPTGYYETEEGQTIQCWKKKDKKKNNYDK
jgi:hypothetical protein